MNAEAPSAVLAQPSLAAPPALLTLRGIRKSFGGAEVLRGVDFDLFPGEVHVLAGENGAGKSTLIKILAGVHAADDGELRLSGGVSVIFQELSLIESMSIVDNLFLGRERAGLFGWLDGAGRKRRAEELCARLGLEVDVEEPVEAYPLSVKQQLEIAKALAFDARVFVMDEPTGALGARETERLFEAIEGLKSQGCGIVYISHRMEEIYRLADRITVLRDGRRIGTAPAAGLPSAELIRWMIGRELGEQYPGRLSALGPERLRVEGLSVSGNGRPAVQDVSFCVREGEILGLAGLQGSGCRELLDGLFGARGGAEGKILLDGEAFAPCSPRHCVARGLAYVTAERKKTGLVLGMGIGENITLAALDAFSPGGWLRRDREREAVERHRRAFAIRSRSAEQPVGQLSGGNQQKVVLAKWAQAAPRVLLLDEPTRGVDVGAKREIYEALRRWTADGLAVLLATTDMAELLGLSDRILALHRGRVRREFTRAEATPERVLAAAMGEAS